MKKRTAKFGSYDTASHGWTLTGWSLSDPEQKTKYTEKPGGDGSWDLSTALTDGVPKYKDRDLTVTLECSEGNRAHRLRLVSELVNLLDGFTWNVVLPDHPEHYLVGRLHVNVLQNGQAYAEVMVTGVVEPWFYALRETKLEYTTTGLADFYRIEIRNRGRRYAVPLFTYRSHDNAGVVTVYIDDKNTNRIGLTSTNYETVQATGALLAPGDHLLVFNGAPGEFTVTWREAVLR